ncbi:uncharacterized protein LOC119450313 [Dermacentor silvarum]|uniref:uncharacterized protein LOC119450313 n=1 Tax=Dermacentor silvarum TaxID=543639 RepID=UPI001897DDE9|nr:uncharacterized protein LOC119450313 [Dermacentor silvarum]
MNVRVRSAQHNRGTRAQRSSAWRPPLSPATTRKCAPAWSSTPIPAASDMDAMRCPTLRGAAKALMVSVLLFGAFYIADALRKDEALDGGSWIRRNPISSRLTAEDTVQAWTTDSERFAQTFLEGSGDGENSYNSQTSDFSVVPPTVTIEPGQPSPVLASTTAADYVELSDSTEPSLASSDSDFIESWGLSRTSVVYPGPSVASPEATADDVTPEPEFMTPSFHSDYMDMFSSEPEKLTSQFSVFSEEGFSDGALLITSSFPVDSTSAFTPTPHSLTSLSPSPLTHLLSVSSSPLLDESLADIESVSLVDIEDVSVTSSSYSGDDSELVHSTKSLFQQTSFPSTTEISISTENQKNVSALNYSAVQLSRHGVSSVNNANATTLPAIESSRHSLPLSTVPTSTSPLYSSTLTTSSLLGPETLLPFTPELLPIEKTFDIGTGSHSSSAATTEMLPTGKTEASYLSSPSALWTSEKGRERTPLGSWHSSAESNRPTLLWFTTSPPATRKTDWFLTSVSKWFVPPSTTLPGWSRSPADTVVSPTSVFNSFGHPDNGSEPSPEALNDQMKYWIRTVMRIERYNHSNTEKLAKNLAFVYEKAFAQRHASRRGRRYTGRSMAVQVVNLSVDYKDQLMSLVYTLSQEGKPVPAETAVEAMSVVNETDMSRLLGYPVVVKAEPYVTPTKTESVSRLAWIVAGVLMAIFVLVVLFLVLYCKCCRPKVHRSPFSDSGSVRSYGRQNRRKMFEESAGKFGSLGEKTYKDVFTSPIHVPSAPPVETDIRTTRSRPKNLSEYFVNKAYEPDLGVRASAAPSCRLRVTSDYDEVSPGLDQIKGGLFDHVPPPPSDSADCPLPLPRKNLQLDVHKGDLDSDSDTSLESTTSAESVEEKTATSAQESFATSLLSDEPSEVNHIDNPGKPCSDEDLKEAQMELDHMKKKIADILDSALEKAAAKKVYGSLRRQRVPPSAAAMRRTSSLKVPKPRHSSASDFQRPQVLSFSPEEPEKKDVPTQTTDLASGKPRVVWSIYKTSEAAAQTSFLDCRLSRDDDSVSSRRTDPGEQSPVTSSVRDSTQAMLSAIRGELRKFSVAQRMQNGESFA